MGVSYQSHSYMGIIVPNDILSEVVRVKTFDHNYSSDWKVDPKNGKNLWKELRVFKKELFPEYGDSTYFDVYDVKIGSYPLFELDNDQGIIIIALYDVMVGHDKYLFKKNSVFKPENFQRDYDVFKWFLQSKNLWNDSFGLYTKLGVV